MFDVSGLSLCSSCTQYGGSSAHASVFKHQRGDWQAATRMRDKLISLRRAINNGWYDDEKQGAINLFLGHFQPRLGQSDLWDLDSDHYLHSGVPQGPYLRAGSF